MMNSLMRSRKRNCGRAKRNPELLMGNPRRAQVRKNDFAAHYGMLGLINAFALLNGGSAFLNHAKD